MLPSRKKPGQWDIEELKQGKWTLVAIVKHREEAVATYLAVIAEWLDENPE